jgi:hypothetical protein
MMTDKSLYFTMFQPEIKSYLVIALRLSANISDRTIHTNCANHEEALDRAKKQYAGTVYTQKGDTEYLICGMCRDAWCDWGKASAVSFQESLRAQRARNSI